MMTFRTMSAMRSIKLVGVLAAVLALGACARNGAVDANNPALSNASAATPGSQQDFVVNVGDRVFFEI